MKTLGKYELLDEIGTGGMGKVCRGRDRVLKREVAIKTIFTGETDPEIKQRFYREARVCAALSHPNIVTVFDLGEQQGTSYIAMEYLEGEDLRRFIDRAGSMSLEAKIDFMADVCEGLAHAHENRIVHRDIKPGNIFILKSGKPKILDFGVARISESRLTQPGTPLGTPRYMAPEQLLGKEADPLSDLFSAAVVFYEFLVFKHPFDDPGGAVVQSIINKEPPSLRSFNPYLPERLDRIFSKALSKSPQARYQTGGEFAKELRKVSLDIVRECSRIWGEAQEHRRRILDLKPGLGEYLNTSWVQSVFKKANVDLSVVDRIAPEISSTLLSELRYFDLVNLFKTLEGSAGVLAQVAEEVNRARRITTEARDLFQAGDIEGAAKALIPIAERFPDHQETVSLMEEIQLRLLAAELEKALASSNLVTAIELLNEIEALECESPEAVELVSRLRSRVGDLSAAKDMLCDSVRATLRQLQGAIAGDDVHKLEKLSFSVRELTSELEQKYEQGKIPDDIASLLSSCRASYNEADLQITYLNVKEALERGDLIAVRSALQSIKERGQDDPISRNYWIKLQQEVMHSIFAMEHAGPAQDAMFALESPTQISPPLADAMPGSSPEGAAAAQTLFRGLPDQTAIGYTNVADTLLSGDSTSDRMEGKVPEAHPGNQQDQICPECGAANPLSNTTCSGCGAGLPDLSKPGPTLARAGVVGEKIHRVSLRLKKEILKLPAWGRAALLVFVAAAILFPAIYLPLHRSAGHALSESVIGKARVLEQSVPLRSLPRDGAAGVATLARGDAVEILGNVPDKKLDAWVLVRPSAKRSRAGYLKLRELTGMETGVSGFDLWHARSMIPDPRAADPALLQARLKEAEAVFSRSLAETESANLKVRLASGYAILASRTLPDREAAAAYTDRAERYMLDLPAPESEKVRTILSEMEKALPTPASQSSVKASIDVSRLLQQAHEAFDGGDYVKAARICEKAVNLNPQSQQAADFLQRVNAARKLKEKLLSGR
jgi:serine/threonine protein kinase/ribosomal protein L40E